MSPSRRRPKRTTLTALAAVALAAALLLPTGSGARSQVAPENTGLPTIAGTATRGKTLTAGSGSWSGTSPIAFSYRWLRCNSAGAACAAISGAISTTHVVVSADVGRRLRVEVTGTNDDGTAAALSAPTAVVSGGQPVNTLEPRVSGATVEDQTLSTTSGSWSGDGPITFTYRWVRCGSDGGNADGGNCSSISGATGTTYKLVARDVGRRLRARVSARNAAGSTTVASNPTATIASKGATGPPVNTAEPRISGATTQGRTLSTTAGSWTGAQPISLAYQWVRCGSNGGKADGSDCAFVGGANRSTYTLGSGDVGRRMRVRVTGANSAGSKVVASNATSTIRASGSGGTIVLANGERSIPVTSVPSTERLIVDAVSFDPNVVRSRGTTITIRVKVEDTRGFVVRDAIVFVRSTPVVTTAAAQTRTGTDGTVTFQVRPQSDFPIRNGYNVQFFVKAFRQGDNPLGGVAGYRLVQVATAHPWPARCGIRSRIPHRRLAATHELKAPASRSQGIRRELRAQSGARWNEVRYR